MNRSRPFTRATFSALLAASAVIAAGQPVGPPPADAFESVVHQTATTSTFTLDRSMLAAADAFFAGQDADARRVAAGLNSITVHNYHYRDYASYDAGAFYAVSEGYRAAGYQHLVNANARASGSLTDLWLRFDGPNVNSLVVLMRGDRNMTAMVVDCTLRPLDLFHLSGHFGIPKVDQNAVMVPAGPGQSGPYAQGSGPSGPPPNGPYTTAPGSAPPPPLQDAPTLKRHTKDDPQ